MYLGFIYYVIKLGINNSRFVCFISKVKAKFNETRDGILPKYQISADTKQQSVIPVSSSFPKRGHYNNKLAAKDKVVALNNEGAAHYNER